jgi:hypothetical protein
MKYLLLILISIILCAFSTKAQNARIENVSIQLTANADSMIIHYDIIGNTALNEVNLEVNNEAGDAIAARSITGDVGAQIQAGNGKTIIWHMAVDSLDIYGSKLFVSVTGNECVAPIVQAETKRWVPWFYIASGASAAFGTFAHFNARNIYTGSYQPARTSPAAGDYHTQVKTWETIRNVAFGSAAVLGGIGVVVHVKHKNQTKPLTLNYYPQPGGAEFGLTFNF